MKSKKLFGVFNIVDVILILAVIVVGAVGAKMFLGGGSSADTAAETEAAASIFRQNNARFLQKSHD